MPVHRNRRALLGAILAVGVRAEAEIAMRTHVVAGALVVWCVLLVLSGCCGGQRPLSDFCRPGTIYCDPLEEGFDLETLDARFPAPWSAYECGGRIIVQETGKSDVGFYSFEKEPPHEVVGVSFMPCIRHYGEALDRDCMRMRGDGDYACLPSDGVCVRSCEADPRDPPCAAD